MRPAFDGVDAAQITAEDGPRGAVVEPDQPEPGSSDLIEHHGHARSIGCFIAYGNGVSLWMDTTGAWQLRILLQE